MATSLPTELLFEIFSPLLHKDLSSSARVCRAWRHASQSTLFQSFKASKHNLKQFLEAIRENCTFGDAVRSIDIGCDAFYWQPKILEDLLLLLPLTPNLQYLDIPTDEEILSKIKDKLEEGLISMNYLRGLVIGHNYGLYWKEPAHHAGFSRAELSTVYSCMQRLPQLTCLNIASQALGRSTLHEKTATLASRSVRQLKLNACLDKRSLRLLLREFHCLELFNYCHAADCEDDEMNSFTSLDLYDELLPHAQSLQELSIFLPDFACVQWASVKSLSNLACLDLDSGVLFGRPTLPQSLQKLFIRYYACEDLSFFIEYLNGEIRLRLNQLQFVCLRANFGVELPEWAHEKIHIRIFADRCAYDE